jgi:hypothetical protein
MRWRLELKDEVNPMEIRSEPQGALSCMKQSFASQEWVLQAALKTHALHTLARYAEVPSNARSVWTAARSPPLWRGALAWGD